MPPVTNTLDLQATEQDRLARLLDAYLVSQERGEAPARAEFLAQHPEDAERLATYLSGLDLLRAAADPHSAVKRLAENTGEQIGEYTLEREIGRGGMGVVYEAVQTSLGRRVALKVLPRTAGIGEKQLARFRNEAQAAAQAQHPHIVPVYAVGEDHGVHYYAMQLIAGHSLADWLAGTAGGTSSTRGNSTDSDLPSTTGAALAGPALDATTKPSVPRPLLLQPVPRDLAAHIRQLAEWGQQAAAALHAAHGCGVVHRDVKPSNLLIDETGKLWVTDFGVARRREAAALTQSGDVLGTMRYMSPEQARGQDAEIDARSDIYSLGVTLYELATGVHPHDGRSALAQLLNEHAAPARPMLTCNPAIPRDFALVIHKALQAAPADRYSSAQALADDLGRFLRGEPVWAAPTTWRRRATKWAQRHRRTMYGVAGAAALGVAGLIVSVVLLSASNRRYLAENKVATERLQKTQEVLDRFAADTAEQLATIPGAEGIRKQIYAESFDFYSQLASEAAADPALAVDVAKAYAKMGVLVGKLGQADESLALLDQAEGALAKAPAKPQAAAERAATLALTKAYRGALLCERREYVAAADVLRQALALNEETLAGSPEDVALKRQLASVAANLAIAERELGQAAEADRHASLAIQHFRTLQTATPNDCQLTRRLADAYNLRGLLPASLNPKAIGDLEEAIRLEQQLVEADPLDTTARSSLARSWNNLGLAHSAVRDWQAAESAFRTAITWQEHLVASSRHAVRHCRDLAISQSNLGAALAQQGRFANASRAFEDSLAQYRTVMAKAPHDEQTKSDAGSVGHNLALTLWRQGEFERARTVATAALTLQESALAAVPSSAEFRTRHEAQSSTVAQLNVSDNQVSSVKN